MNTIQSQREVSPVTTVGNYFVSNYPPFSQWQAELVEQFVAWIQRPVAATGPLGLYVHVPFCRHRCSYCYFRTHIKEAAASMEPYLDAVLAEADRYLDMALVHRRPLSNVYLPQHRGVRYT